MIPWIQVYSNLIKHPKTTALADELGIRSADANPNAVAAGMLVALWLWAAQNAADGDLSACSDRAIAEAAEYKKKPSVFVAALMKTRWLDSDKKLHQWEEYASLLQDMLDRQKANTAERVRRHRERRKQETANPQPEQPEEPPAPDCNGYTTAECNENVTPETDERFGEPDVISGECNGYSNVTETLCNAPTLPNLTLPNLTLPVSTNIIGQPDTTETVVEGKTADPTRRPRGALRVVMMSDSEYEKLENDFGACNLVWGIAKLGEYIADLEPEKRPNPDEHYFLLRRKLWKDRPIRDPEVT